MYALARREYKKNLLERCDVVLSKQQGLVKLNVVEKVSAGQGEVVVEQSLIECFGKAAWQLLPLEFDLVRSRKVVVKGGSWSGKTVLLWRLVRLYLETQSEDDEEYVLPVVVIETGGLSEMIRKGKWRDEDLLLEHLRRQGLDAMMLEMVAKHLRLGRFSLFLDGVEDDEIALWTGRIGDVRSFITTQGMSGETWELFRKQGFGLLEIHPLELREAGTLMKIMLGRDEAVRELEMEWFRSSPGMVNILADVLLDLKFGVVERFCCRDGNFVKHSRSEILLRAIRKILWKNEDAKVERDLQKSIWNLLETSAYQAHTLKNDMISLKAFRLQGGAFARWLLKNLRKGPPLLVKPKEQPNKIKFAHFSVQHLLSASFIARKLNAEEREKVDTYFLGHHDRSQYRISSEWWQPVILMTFDLLGKKCARPVLRSLINRCLFLDGRESLESFWLAACANGNVFVLSEMMACLSVPVVLQALDRDGNNALHVAAMKNQPRVIELLMKHEEHVDSEYLDRNNQHGWDPSNMAMVFNHTECFRLLCRTDGDKVAGQDKAEIRPRIVQAAMDGNLEEVRSILDVSNRGHTRIVPLSPSKRSDTTIKFPIRVYHRKRRSIVDSRGCSGMTAAMWAARNGHANVLAELLKHGAEVVHSKAKGISTILFAVESGHHSCVKLLLQHGASPTDRTPDDDSLLLCACSFGYDRIARTLIQAGACALEALVVSCVQGKDSTVQSILEYEPNNLINSIWHDLMVTPLAGACVAGHYSTVRLLLSLGADPNVPIDVEYGATSLMLACHMGNPQVVELMLRSGADPNTVAPPGSQCSRSLGPNATSIRIARNNNHAEIEDILRSFGAREFIPVDLTFFRWLGGRAEVNRLSKDTKQRIALKIPVQIPQHVDLTYFQLAGGSMEGEQAWGEVLGSGRRNAI